MMKFLRMPLCLLAGMALFAPLSISAADASLMDDGNLMTNEEYAACADRLYQAADETNMNIGLNISSRPLTNEEAAENAKNAYEAIFPEGSDGVFCCIDASSEDGGFAVYTSGIAKIYYADNGLDTRISSIYDDMTTFLYPPDWSDASGAANIFAINMEYFHNEGPMENYCIFDEMNNLYYYAENGEVVSSAEPPAQLPYGTSEPEGETTPPMLPEGETSAETDAPAAEPAYTGDVLLYDEAGRLTQEEYDRCVKLLQDAADRTGMNVGMILGGAERSEYTIESIAVETYDQMFGETTDGILYYMDLSGADSPYDYITTCGMGQFYYSDGSDADRINAIFDDVFPYLYPAGLEDVPGAVEEFAEQVVYYYELGIPDNYYVYDDYYGEYYYVEDGEMLSSSGVPYIDWSELITIGFACFIFGHVVAVIVYFSVKGHYRFKSSLSPTAYVNRKNLVFHNQYDRFVREHTTKTKIESSSSGGGGGRRSGGGSSSRGHGGGGRRR